MPAEDRRARASRRWLRFALPIAVLLPLWIHPAAPAQTSTVSILAGPPAWTHEPTASFRFSTTDVKCRLDMAAWESCDNPHIVGGPLPEGRHVLEVRGATEPGAQDSWTWNVDLTPPTAPTIYEPDGLWQLRRHVTVSWGASDDRSGIGDYDVRYDRWTAGGAARLDVKWVTRAKSTGATFLARSGRTYCLDAFARDRAGNRAPAWSSRRCFALPLDDRALERHGRWTRRTNRFGYLFDGYSQTKQRGAWVSRKVVTTRIVLVAAKCPKCGSVAVRWRGRLVKKVPLRAASTRRRTLIPITSFGARRRERCAWTSSPRASPCRSTGSG